MRRVSLIGASRVFGKTRIAARMSAAFRKLAPAVEAPTLVTVAPAPASVKDGDAVLRHSTGMVERLTCGVAHDINNLLQAVSGSLELLGDLVAGDREAEDLVRNISGSAGRSANLTHQLLSFCRQQLTATPRTDIGSVVARMRELLPAALGSKAGVTFVIEPGFATDLPWVAADFGQIELCLLTMAIGVMDTMNQSGTVVVQAHRKTMLPGGETVIAPGCYVVLSVANKDVRAADRAIVGTTLSHVSDLARGCGGEIRLATGAGFATRVEFWLPLAAAQAAAVAQAAEPAKSAPPRVLLVDDAPDVLITLTAFLEGEGFAVVTARNGRDALAAMAAGHDFDVVVTDYAMPGMSGAELLARIAKIAPGLPAVVVTGFAAIEKLAVLQDNVEILRKPFRRDYLVRRVRALARRPHDGAMNHETDAAGAWQRTGPAPGAASILAATPRGQLASPHTVTAQGQT